MPPLPSHAMRLVSFKVPRSTSSASGLSVLRGMVMMGAFISMSISSRKPTPLLLLLAALVPTEVAYFSKKACQQEETYVNNMLSRDANLSLFVSASL